MDIARTTSMGQGAERAAGSNGLFFFCLFFAVWPGKGLDRLWRLTEQTALVSGVWGSLDPAKSSHWGKDN